MPRWPSRGDGSFFLMTGPVPILSVVAAAAKSQRRLPCVMGPLDATCDSEIFAEVPCWQCVLHYSAFIRWLSLMINPSYAFHQNGIRGLLREIIPCIIKMSEMITAYLVLILSSHQVLLCCFNPCLWASSQGFWFTGDSYPVAVLTLVSPVSPAQRASPKLNGSVQSLVLRFLRWILLTGLP